MSAITQSSPDLATLLSSMDAVDAARNNAELLDEALNLDSRKETLRQKLKATYAAQNITVSDEVIAKGVDEFYEGRYVFKPMGKGLNSVLAALYIKRVKIAKVTSFVLCSMLVAWLGLKMVKIGIAANRESAAKAKVEAAHRAEADAIAAQLKAERAEVARKNAAIAAEASKAAELAALPGKIRAVADTAAKIAIEVSVKTRIEQIATTGIGLAAASDLVGAKASHAELQSVLAQLNQEYDIVINQSGRKGGSDWVTGGWRDFRGNRRYYIVVNAIHNGAPVQVSVTNEEDGSVSSVSSWAEQVTQSTFEEIKAEKMRGSISNPLFARKNKGYLGASYQRGYKTGLPTSEAGTYRITRW